MGFLAALFLTPIVRLVALRVDDVDHPVGLKIHRVATPLMGGVAVYLAFSVASTSVLPLSHPVVGLLIGGLAAIVIGVLDELRNLTPIQHLAGQFIAATIAIVAGVGIVHAVSLPFASLTTPGFQIPLVLGAGFTLLWLVGMMNTMNFLDGLDGLTAGIAALAALLLSAWASEPQRFYLVATTHHEDLFMPLALAGALLGFLPYNWHQARIFLGDSGSMFLGLAVGALAIVGPAKLGTALLVMLIPVLDVAWAIVRRHMRGRSFLAGDKQHVYHRMLELGLGHTQTVLILYALCVAIASLDLLLLKVAKLVAFLVLAVLAGAAFVVMEIRASRLSSTADGRSSDSTHAPPTPAPRR